jgi:FtsP/CotA-like multicopper oxidase with cupredoxin domain
MATEVVVGTPQALTWNNLRPGTYLIESGTQPSIQGPMGLYGVLVVTDAAYPGQTFDKDLTLLLSEIDPVQNAAVALAVSTAGFSDALVWSGQTGACGDPVVHTCYPPAVNYDPRYYLINGVSFDRSNAAASALAVDATATQGRVLLRLVNAGLRMHVPSVVGANMTLLAEDGNKPPGWQCRAQCSRSWQDLRRRSSQRPR